MSQTRVRVWFKRFKEESCDSVKDDARPGRKCTSRTQANINAMQRALHPDCTKTVRMLSEELDIPKTSLHTILHQDLKFSKIAPKLIPKELTAEQMRTRRTISADNLKLLKDNPELLFRVITGDESWVSVKEVAAKQCSLK